MWIFGGGYGHDEPSNEVDAGPLWRSMSDRAEAPSAPVVDAVMLTFSSPSDGTSEDAFNEWYDRVHVPEILEQVSGLVRVTRYRLGANQPAGGSAGAAPYLAVYEIGGAPQDFLESMGRAQLTMSTALGTGERAPISLIYHRLAE